MAHNKIKIIFFGTPKFGSIILEGLVKNNYKPVLVITAPDKPAGRKKIITPPPTKILAQKYGIPVLQPEILVNYKLQITNYKPDLIIVAAFGQILPKKILDIPKYGCLNIHPSLLPKFRGPSPIQTAILNGDKKTGITIYLMDEQIDHGPIIANCELRITNYDTCQTLFQKLAESGAKLLIETIPRWINGEIKPKHQNHKKATYTKIIKKEDARIDWKKSADEIERQIRAFDPWPASFTFIKKNNKILRVKILEAQSLPVPPSTEWCEGKQKQKQLSIKCGKDYLIVKRLQLEGKKPMLAEDFLKGHEFNILF